MLEVSGDGVSVLQPGCARPRRAARSIRRDGNRHAPPLSPRSPLQIHYGAPTGEVQKYTRVTITSHPAAFLDLELPLTPIYCSADFDYGSGMTHGSDLNSPRTLYTSVKIHVQDAQCCSRTMTHADDFLNCSSLAGFGARNDTALHGL